MSNWRAELRGARESSDENDRIVRDMHGGPMLDAMREATMIVTRDARKNAPVDRGILRASIAPEVRSSGREVIGVVGSNQKHAPMMEFGTKPHWPPLDALRVWARRHGMNVYLVARSIARKGIKERRFLRNALTNNAQRIFNVLRNGVIGLMR